MAAILHSNYDMHTYNKGDTGHLKDLFIIIYVNRQFAKSTLSKLAVANSPPPAR